MTDREFVEKVIEQLDAVSGVDSLGHVGTVKSLYRRKLEGSRVTVSIGDAAYRKMREDSVALTSWVESKTKEHNQNPLWMQAQAEVIALLIAKECYELLLIGVENRGEPWLDIVSQYVKECKRWSNMAQAHARNGVG